jgi:hypothetical protein
MNMVTFDVPWEWLIKRETNDISAPRLGISREIVQTKKNCSCD